MRAALPTSLKLATAALLLALCAPAALAQSSLGGADPVSPSPQPNVPTPAPTLSPRMDYIPPQPRAPETAPTQPHNSTESIPWGAIGFTADGSYSTVWLVESKAEAEARVAKKCASYGRGACEVVTVSGRQCVALATFQGSHRGRRWLLSFTAGGMTYPEAQAAAIGRCNADERTKGRCQPRTAACADGR
jgi:hypothetical protein